MLNKNSQNPVVLFCPLNWGLGHATRIVPLVNEELNSGSEVILAASGEALGYLRSEFPALRCVEFGGVSVKSLPHPFLFAGLLVQMPLFGLGFLYERLKLKSIISKCNVTKVISDNRYGVYSNKVKSIIITHQLFINIPDKLRIFKKALHVFTRLLVGRFNECWVPDYDDKSRSLSGDLSHGELLPDNVKYIGPLSRFSQVTPEDPDSIYDIVIIISGPEPEKSVFQKRMLKEYCNYNGRVLMLAGKPSEGQNETIEGSVRVISHLATAKFSAVLKNANRVIARCGYSTVMDMHVLGIGNVEWIPTKGQSEQEYLYKWLSDNLE